jgi:hypothetical protein
MYLKSACRFKNTNMTRMALINLGCNKAAVASGYVAAHSVVW